MTQVRMEGLLGDALAANVSGRLSHFIVDETSPPIALFDPARAQGNHEGDWYGEHAGKWLYAAARAAARTADVALADRVRRVAAYLVSVQEPDGYLGTYASERRFMRGQQPPTRSWDGAPSQRTWDVWTHSYLVLGLLEVNRLFPAPACLEAARRIGDLCWRTLTEGGLDITHLGNHHGLSATVFLDPAVELYFATGDGKYLDLARLILKQADERAGLQLLSQAIAGTDAAEIGTGKAYQLCWNLVGIAKLHRATGEAPLLQAVLNVWESIRRHHLTLGGGPWGGVGHRSREVFNHPSVFSPHGYVETCSILAWIQLNRELLALTGEVRFAEEIERAAYNDLIGAQAPNGEDWCYYSFPNGRRVFTTCWRCCKSSGAMALEELPPIAWVATPAGEAAVNLYGPGRATLSIAPAGTVVLDQRTRYPYDGDIQIRVEPERPAIFPIRLRIPSWAQGASVEVNGVAHGQGATVPGTWFTVERHWQPGDVISLRLPMPMRLHAKSSRSVQESRAPDGTPIEQEVMRDDYLAITRGPLVYATGLIDGYKRAETLRIPDPATSRWVELVTDPAGEAAPVIRLHAEGRAPLTFVPYFEAGGRSDGTWRLTWMQVL